MGFLQEPRSPPFLQCVLEQTQMLMQRPMTQQPEFICFVLSLPPPCPPVIDGLDLLKKEHPGARDGIRYLEAEFKKGNR